MNPAAVQALLWYCQRVSAMVLAVCVPVHLGTLIYAVHRGLTAASILGRTHANVLFGAFYAVFVLACAVHVPIGVATVAREWLGLRGRGLLTVGVLLAAALAAFGLRAVYAVVAA